MWHKIEFFLKIHLKKYFCLYRGETERKQEQWILRPSDFLPFSGNLYRQSLIGRQLKRQNGVGSDPET